MNISPWAVILALPLTLAAAAGEEAPSLSVEVSEPASTMDAPSAPDELDLAVDRWPIFRRSAHYKWDRKARVPTRGRLAMAKAARNRASPMRTLF